MWQRVQTLYLFIATALMVSLFFCERAQGLSFTAYWPYLVLIILVSLLNFLALTTWKFRVFQMRTAVLSSIITLAFQAWLLVEYFSAGEDVIHSITILFPFAALVFDLLAAKNILSDELMVRSASRLRSRKKK